ncbi:MAG: hypothetical protein PHS14_06155 [Elusimicrobia bacterium]|nr:hypothetical protein [Elusimicrobiota bacterium]
MSVSAHLTPEPERRLWLILESMRHAVDWADLRIGALTAFAVAELAFIKILLPVGPPGFLALVSLTVALPLGVFAFAPLKRLPKWLHFLEPHKGRMSADDSLITVDDLVKYSHGDLIFRLDKYLGGGITATPYYEDIIGQIVENARAASRKQSLFRAECVVVGIGQLGLLGQLIWR